MAALGNGCGLSGLHAGKVAILRFLSLFLLRRGTCIYRESHIAIISQRALMLSACDNREIVRQPVKGVGVADDLPNLISTGRHRVGII